jgi:hypothetical protein
MLLYHYLLCDSGGRVTTTLSAKHESDGAAHTAAAKMLPRQGVHRIEVWQGDRRLQRAVTPPDPTEHPS